MDITKLVLFVIAAPVLTAVVCKVMEAFKKPSAAEVARAQAAAQAARQDAMTSAVGREALRQEERSELTA